MKITAEIIKDIQEYIEQNLIVLPGKERRIGRLFGIGSLPKKSADSFAAPNSNVLYELQEEINPELCQEICADIAFPKGFAALDEDWELPPRDESFKEMLFRIIDERGEKDSDVYKRAQLTRGHFNKIKNEEGYRPKLSTVVALGFALNLPREQFDELLRKAGYALSRTTKFDLIIEYCLDNGIYDITDINEVLFRFDQELLGAGIRD